MDLRVNGPLVLELTWQGCGGMLDSKHWEPLLYIMDTMSAVVSFWMDLMGNLMLSLSSQCHLVSPPPPSVWWAGLWHRTALVDCLQVETSVIFCESLQLYRTKWHVITPLICCLSARFPPQADQSGPGLCHHDQHLWVWKGLFSQTQPGEDTGAAADQ